MFTKFISDEYVLGECVSILALIPKECAGGWRVQVLKAALVLTFISIDYQDGDVT